MLRGGAYLISFRDFGGLPRRRPRSGGPRPPRSATRRPAAQPGTPATGDAVDPAARLARECTLMRHALALARWVSPGGRPVTAGRVLRRADVAAAGALLSVPVPARVRTAADVGQLHRPWCLAVAMGLIRVGEGRASSGPALELWPLSDAESLAGWLAGLRAVCAAESYPQDEDSVRLLARGCLCAHGILTWAGRAATAPSPAWSAALSRVRCDLSAGGCAPAGPPADGQSPGCVPPGRSAKSFAQVKGGVTRCIPRWPAVSSDNAAGQRGGA